MTNKKTLYSSLMLDAPKLLIRIISICIFLALVYSNIALSFGAAIICLMWIRSEQEATLRNESNNFRFYKALFVKIGSWLKQENVSGEYDKILSETQMIDFDLEDDFWKQIVTGEAIYQYSKGIIVFGLEIYIFITAIRGAMQLL